MFSPLESEKAKQEKGDEIHCVVLLKARKHDHERITAAAFNSLLI